MPQNRMERGWGGSRTGEEREHMMWHVHSAIYKVESVTVPQTCSTYVLLLQPDYKVAGGQAGGGKEGVVW